MRNFEISKAYESIEVVEEMLRKSGLDEPNSNFDIKSLASIRSFKARVDYCRQNLKFLGRGSSRIVFLMANGHVLKLAWNGKGVAQNEAEGGDWYLDSLDCFAHSFNHAEDFSWLESEAARKCSKSEFRSLMGYSFETMCDCIVLMARQRGNGREFPFWRFKDEALAKSLIEKSYDGEYDDILYSISEYIGNYGASSTCADFLRIANWGIVNRDGKDTVVIVDSGFSTDVADHYYGRR